MHVLLTLTAGEIPARQFEVAQSDTTDAEKEQVEKKDTKKKDQPAATKTDDSDSTLGCFGSCLGGLLGSFCSGILEDDEPQAEVAPEERGGVTTVMAIPYDATISSENPHIEEVSVWDRPGGRGVDAAIVSELPLGIGVTVTERHTLSTTHWVRINTKSTPGVTGWVHEGDLLPDGYVPGTIPEEQLVYDATEQNGALLLSLSFPVFTEDAINDEYEKGIGTLGFAGRFFTAHNIQMGFSVSYTHAWGDPKFDYVVGSVTESPSDSELQILALGLRFGQLYRLFGPAGFILWEIGPSAFYVNESATITVIENKAVIETRTDEISEWEPGVEIRLEIGGMILQFPLSAHVVYSVFPWESNEEKSLTFDFLESDRVNAFSFGLTFGYSFY
jgi:hypothetical protein